MYQLLLVSKYLRRKLAPLFAASAVTLCTAMVIIVISVMGGFFDLLAESAQRLTGDLIVTNFSLHGFEHYDDLLAELEAMPEIEAATPMIHTFGLISVYGDDAQAVRIVGIEPEAFDQIVDYRDTLYWSNDDYKAYLGEHLNEDQATRWAERIDIESAAMSMSTPPWTDAFAAMPAAVLGIEVNPRSFRDEQGQYRFSNSTVERVIRLTVVPMSPDGGLDVQPIRRDFAVVNEFKSGLYEVDQQTVFVDFDWLQNALAMAPTTIAGFDPETGEPNGQSVELSGRVTEIVCKITPGQDLEATQDLVNERIAQLWERENFDSPYPPVAITWIEQHGQLLKAVQNEKGLVTVLFVIISIVAVVMVATTFYMIVLEKTRDIGTLRAIGASRSGIMGIFLGYGLGIGLLGAVVGVALASVFVVHLNDLQERLAEDLGAVLLWSGLGLTASIGAAVVGYLLGRRKEEGFAGGALGFLLSALVFAVLGVFAFELLNLEGFNAFDERYGWRMWDPQLYFFETIPSRLDPGEVVPIAIGAVLSSVVGALIPALLAARLNPIDALRYE